MRSAAIYRNGEKAGVLTEHDDRSYSFQYDDAYVLDGSTKPVSLTLPKTSQQYTHPILFPFFSNMLAEGANRKLQSRALKIDEEDEFGLLLATASVDAIGAITVKPIEP